MDQAEFDQKWGQVEELIRSRFGRKPNLEAILFLVGIQESGIWKTRFTKEQKQDLMHVAVCALLSRDGFYRQESRDAEGWPHYSLVKPVPPMDAPDQERMLKECLISYFLEEGGTEP
ncbi:MAG TPA: hypothetical protein VMV20_05755 [Chitinophagaceae bacterium]|nr:hypothetical protein [Chitinophagaceae bacterium]